MVFSSIVSSPRGTLSPRQALKLANVYLENACHADDADIALVLCHDTEVSLYQAKKAVKRAEDQYMIKEIATAYIDLGNLLERRGHGNEAKVSYKKAGKLGVNVQDQDQLAKTSRPSSIMGSFKGASPLTGDSQDSGLMPSLPWRRLKPHRNIVTMPAHIFAENVRPPVIECKLPGADERLSNTLQLAGCLYLLQPNRSPDDILEPAAYNWLQVINKDADEQIRLRTMATEVIRAYKRDEMKDANVVSEVVCLAPVLNKDAFQDLLSEFYSGIDNSGLLKFHQLEGLAQLIQSGDQEHLSSDDLVKILGLLSNRLTDTHQQSSEHMHKLTLAVSHVLDAMADTKVKDLDREKLHEPLSAYLSELKSNSDPYLVYQAAYAFQALLWVPDDETTWQAAMRHTGKIIQGVSGLVSAVKGLDLNKFIEGLGDIQEGVAGAAKVVEVIKNTYDDVTALAQSGQGFLGALKEGFSFERKRDWYSALRGADALIRDGELATFRKLVCEVPCRMDVAFQWGVCQRLGEIAANPMWDANIRQNAIEFLGEMYRNDDTWGGQPSVKQWILNILMQLASSSRTGAQLMSNSTAETLLRELESSGDDKKQVLYRSCRDNGPTPYPLKVPKPETTAPSLLDRVQNRPDVEGNIRSLRKKRTVERGNAVYIAPQAKSSLQATDGTRFPLMEKVKEFLNSDQKVFLLIGDSGSGKSTFNKELEYALWQSYKNKTGRIPLHINLPAIDKPEHDMIAKQLRRTEFTEPQIREMKHYRKFILICDGYDESQQTYNLYMSNRLNQVGEWDAQMVISCRTEYLGADYRDRFQPGDRNQQSGPSMFQEAVLTPFSLDQVQDYIQQYVTLHQPLWRTDDYKQALKLIPSLKDLMKNPFLMALSLEVLPRMVDPGLHLSAARVTRVGLYDHFVEQWLERGKKRLGEKDLSPQARAAFESLSDEGFAVNGTEYLKKLAVAIYKEQDGHPIVEYSRLIDGASWKAEFFTGEDKQLLREACPLTRSGNQHRFVHRSLLEYGLAHAVFDPQDRRMRSTSKLVTGRRGSESSTLSFEIKSGLEDQATALEMEPDVNSPLVWRNFVNDHSLLQFLEERVQQEPVFKDQLLAYIEHSKKDKKWRQAAANAITILVRAGVQFIGTDLQGIRIPGADLSYGVFDSAQLQNADLRKANLRGVWLRQTNLSRAQMTGVQFGELPYLTEAHEVRSCAYSADGKSLVVGLFNGNINIYSTSSWERTRTWSGHSRIVMHVVYSPKGDRIASVGEDTTVRLWDTDTGSQIHLLKGHSHYVYGAAFSPQGDLIASASGDNSIRIWDVFTGDCRKILYGHSTEVLCIAYSPSGNRVVSGGADSTVRLWNVETGECSRILSGHSDYVWEVAYSPNGGQVVSAGRDNMVRLWDMETGACLFISAGHTSTINCVAYSPNGDQVASASLDGTVRLWDVETGSCRHTLTGHVAGVLVVTYSPNGDQVASGGYDKTLRLWNISADASHLVSSGHSRDVRCIDYSPTAHQIASGSTDKTIRLWDVETGACRRILSGHTDPVFGVSYSPKGDLLASAGSNDRSVRLWKTVSGECQHILTGHRDRVNDVAFSHEGDTVASASNDGIVRLWDAATGDCRKILRGHTVGVLEVLYAPGGKQVVTRGKDKIVRVWDIESGEWSRILEGHTDWSGRIAFSPQGDQLASIGEDISIKLWDVTTGECRFILIGHTAWIMSVVYSVNGRLLASGGRDKIVRLWDVSSGECRALVEHFPGFVNCVAWCASSDANSLSLVTGCQDGSVLKWQVIEEHDQCHVRLLWSASKGALTVTGASIQGARGLTLPNKMLLKQRGVAGEPEHLFRETSKKIITMASVVSKLKDSLSPDGLGVEQSEQLE
ncbi:MAG: WD40-repeat-containing domain protein [Benniella sp.]|nr:MAG: WD40-repeat-containing domain protein [Benniella sp.]